MKKPTKTKKKTKKRRKSLPEWCRLPRWQLKQNRERSEVAGKTLRHFEGLTNSDKNTSVYDLICNLRHYCDRNGLDFEVELALANKHYRDEINPEGLN